MPASKRKIAHRCRKGRLLHLCAKRVSGLRQKIDRLIIQRSRLLVALLWVFMSLNMVKYLLDDRPLLWVGLVGIGLLAALTWVVLRSQQAQLSMYSTVALVYAYALLLLCTRPSVVNYMFLWLSLMISAFYQEYGPIILAGGLTIGMQIFGLRAYGPLIFPASRPVDVIYPVLLGVFITLFLLYLTRFTKRLWLTAEQAEQQLRGVLGNADIVTWVIPRFGEAPVVSEGLCEIAGLAVDQLPLPADWWQRLVHPDDFVRLEPAVQRLQQGHRQQVEVRIVRTDGGSRWVQCRMLPIRDQQGAVLGMQGVLIDITQRKLMEQQIQFLAYHDSLTSLPNRTLFFELAGNSLLQAKREAALRACFFIDLDGFKQVNDTAGHGVGDQALAEIARRLQSGLRAGDLLCRLGGDEFAALLQIETKTEALAVAERLFNLISQPILLAGSSFAVGCSIGISFFPDHGLDADTLTQAADQAMYQAKAGAGNPWRVYAAELGGLAGGE